MTALTKTEKILYEFIENESFKGEPIVMTDKTIGHRLGWGSLKVSRCLGGLYKKGVITSKVQRVPINKIRPLIGNNAIRTIIINRVNNDNLS